ncbi:MAG: TonB family protein [Wenzhouxiangella sp.]|nr:TonB family protein [Wenzhouxiangella sp.]TVR98088.1 MAG: TonB family protein [Wenzhouxiangellaceae bacterium]
MDLFNHTLIQQLGLTLLHFVWQGLAIGLLYALALLIWQPSRSESRYNLAVATLVALAAMPVLTLTFLIATSGGQTSDQLAATADAAAALMVQTSELSAHPSLGWVVSAWLIGVCILALRLGLGWHYLHRLRRSANPLPAAGLLPQLELLRQRFGIDRHILLAISERVQSPVVIGWLKPLILLPPAMINRVPLEQIEMILAHELAHIRRHDHLVNLFQTVVETLLFYHPVVAWISRRIRVERENACDDLAVAMTDNRLGYVEMLASLEHFRQPGKVLALGLGDGQILTRIRRLVEQTRPDRQRGLSLPLLALISALGAGTTIHLMSEREVDSAKVAVTEAPMPVADPTSASAALPMAPAPDPLSWDFPDPGPAPSSTAELEAPASRPVPAQMTETTLPAQQPVPETAPAAPPAANPAPASSTETMPQPVEPVPTERPAIDAPALAMPFPADQGLALAALPEPPRSRQPSARPGADTADPLPISGGELIHRVDPRFPARARMRQASGLVALQFTVGADGRVADVEILDETPANLNFGSAASAAVAEWRFEPFRQGQEVLARRVRVEIEFSAEESCRETLGSRIPRC